MLIDSHAHLTSPPMFVDIDDVLRRAKDGGVSAVVNICTDVKTLEDGIVLANRYPWVFNAAATTPHDVEKEGEEVFPVMEAAARQGQLVAVGETGLDYYYEHADRRVQKDFLRRYLCLAKDCQLPVVIHCRDAFADFFSILDEEYVVDGKHLPGVLHCFTGTAEEAKEVIARGWYLSLSGIVTYKRSDVLREVAKEVPIERLLVETDSPYLAPQSHRGERNEPAFVKETTELIANVKGIPWETLAKSTADNTRKLFSLPS